ncbi:MAG: PSD1 and planctomycete cytochrome C domain-containing protein, partial [Planctomycetota bacterium]
MNTHQRIIAVSGLLWSASLACAATTITPEQEKFFETKIRPVLVRECYGCHSDQAGNVRGGLRLDTRELTHIGGGSGPAVVPGEPSESLLFTAMTHEDFEMPPRRKLSDAIINDFRRWIEMGAPDPRVSNVAEIQSSIDESDIEAAKRDFWAYQPPKQTQPPRVIDLSWPRGEIDRHVLARLEDADLPPADDASSLTVLRRLCFDLIGLPPTPVQIDYFSSIWETDPERAIEHVVDRLLDQPQFGERWGRHWLDVVRYAESTGREVNMTYPHAWRYRDYVIDSFNDDKPFDRFVQEHIAGDLLPASNDQQWSEQLVATTFLAMGAKNLNEQNRVQFQADLVDEQIDATSRVFLGMSVACARCHDHKFDAIPQSDYYALAGVFGSMETYFGVPPSKYGSFTTAQTKRTSSLIRLPIDDPNPFDPQYSKSELAKLESQIEDTMREMSEFRRNNSGDSNAAAALRQRLQKLNQLSELSAKLAVVDSNGNPISYCMGVQEKHAAKDARLLVRGEIDQPSQSVSRGFPQVLCRTPVVIDRDESGRLQLARWIGSDDNTLTARVMVNRIWQQLIGNGLVTSTENFGVTGSPPSHPALLDHLALEFVDSGWSVKSMIRQIATSRTYRMASTFHPEHHQADPDNALIWRANPRQLDAEAVRDSMLAISGQLQRQRPRGSVVAEAGYMRVRDGSLEDPREVARRAFDAMRQRRPVMMTGLNGRGSGTNRGFGGSAMGAGGMTSRFGNSRRGVGNPSMGESVQDVIRKAQNQLDMEDANFRSVYLPIVRDAVPRALEVFDFADASTVTGTRE